MDLKRGARALQSCPLNMLERRAAAEALFTIPDPNANANPNLRWNISVISFPPVLPPRFLPLPPSIPNPTLLPQPIHTPHIIHQPPTIFHRHVGGAENASLHHRLPEQPPAVSGADSQLLARVPHAIVLQLKRGETGSLALLEVQLPGAVDGPVTERARAGEAEGAWRQRRGVVEEEADQGDSSVLFRRCFTPRKLRHCAGERRYLRRAREGSSCCALRQCA